MRKDFPTLYAVSTSGKITQWTISVLQGVTPLGQPDEVLIVRTSGYVGGKLTPATKKVKAGKNIGRSNETTPWEQAIAEATSTYQKQLDKMYTPEMPNLATYVSPEFPMLAHKFQERKHNIKYPAFVQPKLNGVRCLAKKVSATEITYTSRGGKSYDATLQHLTKKLLPLMKIGQILDGEVYIHGETFQHIIRLVKKLRPESVTLQYHIYDIASSKDGFVSRNAELIEMLTGNPCNELVLVDTREVKSEAEVYTNHNIFVQDGYEGVIVRNRNGLYLMDGRSNDLQKYKEFFDAEYTITGGKEGIGADEGCIVFECTTKSGETFNVRPRGTVPMRREMFKNLKSLIGKELTVRYQELSEGGTPIFPVGIAVRDYE